VWLRQLLRRLADEGRAVLVSSHLMAEMAHLADHLVVIGRGRLLADTTPQALTAGYHSLEAAFLALTSADVTFQSSRR
jgi:ABC-2 type transport system ATP-binding protein